MWLNGVAAKAKLDAEATSVQVKAQAKVEADARSAPTANRSKPAEGSTLQDQLEQLRSLGKAVGRQVSNLSEDAVRAVTGLVEASLGRPGPPPPPAAELHGTFALVKSGMLGTTHLEPRAFSLIRGRGKETMLNGRERRSMRGGAGGVCYEVQSIDMKGVVHRIVLQKTDEVKHLDHNKLSFSLVSAAAEGEDHTHRFKFQDKELFNKWAHALMVAIKNSERRNNHGSLVQMMSCKEGLTIKLNADL